jgi:integrase
LVIDRTKFRKSRLVPLHERAGAALERYLQQRRQYAPLAAHVFVSVVRKPLRLADVDRAFKIAARQAGLPNRSRHPTPHALRHAFATQALSTCPDGRDAITRHMLALSTYLGHSTWLIRIGIWKRPQLMRNIAEQTERLATGRRS